MKKDVLKELHDETHHSIFSVFKRKLLITITAATLTFFSALDASELSKNSNYYAGKIARDAKALISLYSEYKKAKINPNISEIEKTQLNAKGHEIIALKTSVEKDSELLTKSLDEDVERAILLGRYAEALEDLKRLRLMAEQAKSSKIVKNVDELILRVKAAQTAHLHSGLLPEKHEVKEPVEVKKSVTPVKPSGSPKTNKGEGERLQNQMVARIPANSMKHAIIGQGWYIIYVEGVTSIVYHKEIRGALGLPPKPTDGEIRHSVKDASHTHELLFTPSKRLDAERVIRSQF